MARLGDRSSAARRRRDLHAGPLLPRADRPGCGSRGPRRGRDGQRRDPARGLRSCIRRIARRAPAARPRPSAHAACAAHRHGRPAGRAGRRSAAGRRPRWTREDRRRGVVGARVHAGPGAGARNERRGRRDPGRDSARLRVKGATVVAQLIVVLVVVLFVIMALARSIRIVPQARARVVERLGRYHRTLTPGLAIVVPFMDRLRPLIDLREQVVSFPPQPVITEDNLVVNIDSVIYFQVTDAKAASYEIANYIQAIEQLTVTTLRNVIGGMALEKTLTSRDEINSQLRGVLDEATGKWGIRVNRVELKAIDPPGSIKDSMEKQMRAERDKRAAILNAEGFKQSQILTAEGEKQSAILSAEGLREWTMLEAGGRAQAIDSVFKAIQEGKPDAELLAYQYLQMLPQIAQGEANKMWIIPSELTQALGTLGGRLTGGNDQNRNDQIDQK